MNLKRFLATAFLLSASSVVNAQIQVDNCGHSASYQMAPTRAITMNQSATEIMLALGLADKMVGTAYLDDAIWPELEEEYKKVPVLAEKYPSREVLYASAPDFVYAAYSSAFKPEYAGGRDELRQAGIDSYLSPAACADKKSKENRALDSLYAEINQVAAIFNVEDRADQLISKMKGQIDKARNILAAQGKEEVSVFWYDSGDDKAYAGACCGMPGAIIEAVGAKNAFSDQVGRWAKVSWEAVVARNPDVIVIVDASWSTAQSKIDFLKSDPAFATLDAVKYERFVVLPFSSTTAGIRNGQAILDLATGLSRGEQ